ncbi:hypothetical protein [Actinomadura hibisca]|uniref:hypothetical protein n=1 Tax=Actinomadura hibisca TaxID=68565 RepID=UPI0012FC581F|nr:hypothetical protein [Actinomadura hibisca]
MTRRGGGAPLSDRHNAACSVPSSCQVIVAMIGRPFRSPGPAAVPAPAVPRS